MSSNIAADEITDGALQNRSEDEYERLKPAYGQPVAVLFPRRCGVIGLCLLGAHERNRWSLEGVVTRDPQEACIARYPW